MTHVRASAFQLNFRLSISPGGGHARWDCPSRVGTWPRIPQISVVGVMVNYQATLLKHFWTQAWATAQLQAPTVGLNTVLDYILYAGSIEMTRKIIRYYYTSQCLRKGTGLAPPW